MARTTALRIKRWLPLFVPPIVGIGLRRLHAGQDAEYEFAGHRWPTEKVFRGWDVESVASRHERGWRQLEAAVSGSGPLTENGVVAHNTLMCVGYALGRALQGRSSVSMLDWGGGAGEYGLIARGMYPDAEIDYCCRELPKLAELGRALLPPATFFDSDEAALSRTYDFVLVSASLHYTPDWALLLRRLAGVADAYVFVTRQPFVDKAASYVASPASRPQWLLRHRVPRMGPEP